MAKLDLVYALFGENAYFKLKKTVMQLRENSEMKQLKLNNVKYKDQHKGERCFILGNGPSLKKIDLELLADEVVFTCNNFARVEGFEKAKPNYHLWVDEAFFELRDDNKMDHQELMYNYNAISKLDPICFIPAYGKEYIEKHKLNEILNLNYFNILEWISDEHRISYDLSTWLTGYTTVVQYAITMAIYMGFSEIYLLGCDSTNIIAMLNVALEVDNKEVHAYDNDDSDKRFKHLLGQWKMTDVFRDQYTLFLGYKKLKELCDQKGIVIKNLSNPSLINEIERDNINNILGV